MCLPLNRIQAHLLEKGFKYFHLITSEKVWDIISLEEKKISEIILLSHDEDVLFMLIEPVIYYLF